MSNINHFKRETVYYTGSFKVWRRGNETIIERKSLPREFSMEISFKIILAFRLFFKELSKALSESIVILGKSFGQVVGSEINEILHALPSFKQFGETSGINIFNSWNT